MTELKPFDYFKKVLTEDYANFKGRARRAEYWYFVLFYLLIVIAVGAVGMIFGLSETNSPILVSIPMLVLMLAVLVPSLAVQVRRLHDTDRSGWWLLLNLLPYAGALILLVILCLEGTKGPNKYGPDPKERESGIAENLV